MDVRAIEVGTLEVPRSRINAGTLGYSAEASTIGIPPGLWPVHIVVRWDAERTQRFSFCRADRDLEGDTTSVLYLAGPANLDRLVVWND